MEQKAKTYLVKSGHQTVQNLSRIVNCESELTSGSVNQVNSLVISVTGMKSGGRPLAHLLAIQKVYLLITRRLLQIHL